MRGMVYTHRSVCVCPHVCMHTCAHLCAWMCRRISTGELWEIKLGRNKLCRVLRYLDPGTHLGDVSKVK